MFLYKNVLFYFQKNNCVDYDLAAGLVERRHSDSLRATSGEVEAWLRGVHAPGVGDSILGKSGTYVLILGHAVMWGHLR
jgi:hypothetical protein